MKELICALIEDDIRHTLLLRRLDAAGFDTTDEVLGISDVIFKLTGVDQCENADVLCKGYFDLIKGFSEIDATPIGKLSNSMFLYLVAFTDMPR